MSKIKEFRMVYTNDARNRKYEILGDGIYFKFKDYEVDELMNCQHYISVYKDGKHIFSGDSLEWLLENNFNNNVKNALINLECRRVSKFNELHVDYTIEKEDRNILCI